MTTTPTPTPASAVARGPQWTAARQRQALDLGARYRHGATVRELAAAEGLAPATVLSRLRMVDTPMRTQQQTRILRHGADRAAQAQQLRASYQAGASVMVLADRHGLSVRTVRRLLREAGAVMRSSSQTRALQRNSRESLQQEWINRLRSRYEAGAEVPALAAEHGCSTSTLYRLLRRAGTPMRPRGRSPRSQATAPP